MVVPSHGTISKRRVFRARRRRGQTARARQPVETSLCYLPTELDPGTSRRTPRSPRRARLLRRRAGSSSSLLRTGKEKKRSRSGSAKCRRRKKIIFIPQLVALSTASILTFCSRRVTRGSRQRLGCEACGSKQKDGHSSDDPLPPRRIDRANIPHRRRR